MIRKLRNMKRAEARQGQPQETEETPSGLIPLEEIRNHKERDVRKAIRSAMWKDFDQFPCVWVARDDDNSLWLYTEKPQNAMGYFVATRGEMIPIDDGYYPEITYENSPIKIRLIFIDA